MDTPTSIIDSANEHASSSKTKSKVKWSPENETILVEWCDIAQCYKWLNTRAHHKYSNLQAWFTIPAIILSTFSGTASFAQESIPIEMRSLATMAVGTVNIAVGILTTIQQYLKISERNESHRVSSIAWDKYARNVRIELSKAPLERLDAELFIKHHRDEFDRLMETNPTIPEKIIKDFMTTFAHSKDPVKKKQFEALKKPDICDIIVSADENRHHWYKELASYNTGSESTELESLVKQDLLKRQEELRTREQEMHDYERTREENERAHAIETRERKLTEKLASDTATKSVDEYVKMFEAAHGRPPIPDEITEKFNGKIEDKYLKMYLADYTLNSV